MNAATHNPCNGITVGPHGQVIGEPIPEQGNQPCDNVASVHNAVNYNSV